MAPGAPRLHDHAPGNVLSVSEIKRSNVDAALASAAHVVSETFQTQFIEHAFLEPESSLAYSTDGSGVHFYSQDQDIWSVSRQVASLLGLSQDKVLATLVSSGGAFGAKEDLGIQRHAALLGGRTDRPVKLTLSPAESLRFHVKRHPLTLTYTVGCDGDGRLLGLRVRIVGDTGAYTGVGSKVRARDALAAGAARAGRTVTEIDRPQLVACSVDTDRAAALDRARGLLTQYLRQQPHIMKASGVDPR
jgi:aldehyde oxidoreductase